MNDLTRSCALLAASIALSLAGCAGEVGVARQYELRGQYDLAYKEYCRAVTANPRDGVATAGLRRTAPIAAGYYQRLAFTAAEEGRWEQAAKYHLEVLQIKPNEFSSTFSLRQIARQHPDNLAAAYAALSVEVGPGELLAMAEEPRRQPKAPLPAGRPGVEPGPKAPPGQRRPAPPVVVKRPPAEKPAPPPPQPRRPAPVTPPPAPEQQVDLFRQRPGVRREYGASQGDFLMIVRVSRDDHRFPKQAGFINGLEVKVNDTDKSPLDADIEVYLSGKRIGKFKNLPEDSVISVLDRLGTPREIVIMNIYDPKETVTVGLRGK